MHSKWCCKTRSQQKCSQASVAGKGNDWRSTGLRWRYLWRQGYTWRCYRVSWRHHVWLPWQRVRTCYRRTRELQSSRKRSRCQDCFLENPSRCIALEDKTAAFRWLKDVVFAYLLYKMKYFIGLSATIKFDNHGYELFMSFNIFLITMVQIKIYCSVFVGHYFLYIIDR